ncbi:MAG: outer membrane lipoprotein-sorting protein [Kofleriaceae bacterium]
MKRLLVATLVVGSALPAFADAPTGPQIMEKVENRDEGKDQIAKVTLEIHPKQGSVRQRQLVIVRKEYPDVTKLATFFLAPTDVRGAAFLAFDKKSGDDQRWLYLPTIGQVRRLAAESNRQSFFNSDFVYEDLTNRDPDLDDHKLVGSQKVDEWECWVVESTPKNARGLEFVKYKTWVWKTADLPVRQEYFDSAGKVVRRGQLASMKQIQGIWTWHQGTMTNLVTGSVTKLQMSEVKYNTNIPDERFAEAQLARGIPKE